MMRPTGEHVGTTVPPGESERQPKRLPPRQPTASSVRSFEVSWATRARERSRGARRQGPHTTHLHATAQGGGSKCGPSQCVWANEERTSEEEVVCTRVPRSGRRRQVREGLLLHRVFLQLPQELRGGKLQRVRHSLRFGESKVVPPSPRSTASTSELESA